jgi:hypothetical protein
MKTGTHPKSIHPSMPLVGKTISYERQSMPLWNRPVAWIERCKALINKEVAWMAALISEGDHK